MTQGVSELSVEKENEKQIFPGAMYECVRCGTRVTGKELAKLPEPTCANCGYRAFRKVRQPGIKNLEAQWLDRILSGDP